MNYLNLIKKLRNRKYSNYLNFKKEFFLSYITSRQKFIKKNKNINHKFFFLLKKNFIFKNRKYDTYKYLLNTYIIYQTKKTISTKDQKFIYLFYKKYESNLKLKKNYNLILKKITNTETNIYSYILLCFFLILLNTINTIQKLNCLIKLNDHILLNIKKIKNKFFLNLFKDNLKKEIILLKKFSKKK